MTIASPREVLQAVPAHCLERSTARSLAYLGCDVLLFAGLVAAILSVDSAWLATPLALLLGTVLTGLFVVGHDCGHRSFSDRTALSDVVGEFATGIALWPFHVWRLSHDLHHRHTHHIEKDIAWVPFTTKKLGRLAPLDREIYWQTRAGLWFLGSWFFTFYFVKDALRGEKSRHFRAEDRQALRRSVALTAFVQALYLGLAAVLAGWYGVVFLWLIPQTVFQFWLSTFTLLHHTHPEQRFLADSEWSFADAQLGATIHVAYPRAVEWLAHDINWHVPHHVCVGIPHYRLRDAHRALKARFPGVREEVFGPGLLLRVIRTCRQIEDKTPLGLAWRDRGLPSSSQPADIPAAPPAAPGTASP